MPASSPAPTLPAPAALVRACQPSRFPDMSGKMAALLGFLLGQDWADPRIVDLRVTSDGHLISYTARGDGYEGTDDELRANLRRLAAATAGTNAEVGADGLRWLLARVDSLRA